MTRRGPSLAWLLAAATVAAAPASRRVTNAHVLDQQATFRATTNLVQVDAVVHDRGGRFVLGLGPDDLEVFEDGVRQRVEQFYVVMKNADTGMQVSTGERNPRVFLLVFDERDLDVGALQRMKKGAEAFLMNEFRPGDLGGVVVDGEFYRSKITTDRTVLLAALKMIRPATDSREIRLRPFRDFPRIPGEAEAVRIATGDSFLLRQLGTDACAADPRSCNAEGGRDRIENRLQQKARVYLGQARDATRYTLQSLRHATSAAAGLPGRKTVVFFSDGFFVDEVRTELQIIAGEAARGGVTIYGVDGRGLGGGVTAAGDVTSQERPIDGTIDTSGDGPQMLAGGTGGFIVRRTDDIAAALGRIARDTSSYYVVGYRPTNPAADGTYRRIVVKPRSTEITVRARAGYVASRK